MTLVSPQDVILTLTKALGAPPPCAMREKVLEAQWELVMLRGAEQLGRLQMHPPWELDQCPICDVFSEWLERMDEYDRSLHEAFLHLRREGKPYDYPPVYDRHLRVIDGTSRSVAAYDGAMRGWRQELQVILEATWEMA